MSTTTADGDAVASSTPAAGTPMSHRQILEAMSGLLLGMFVAMLSSTVVTNALPKIITTLHGTESGYTWIVAVTLLTMTATTPVWGKLSDLISPKFLVQLSIVVYVAGSAIAGLSENVGMLIGARAIQGVGVGGLMALVQIIMARIVSPRERGRYSGYIGAVFATATVLGPIVGGVIVDTSWLGWRWCFYIGVPFAVAALIVLQKTLKLEQIKRKVTIDYLGASLIVAGVSLLLIWVSLAGTDFAWVSLPSALMVLGGVAVLALALVVEQRAAEPIIPLGMFRDSTVALASVASLFIGSSLYGVTVFLSQYFQLSRLQSPTVAGLATMPMVMGMFLTSLIVGKLISRTGLWRRYLVGGSISLVAGLVILGTMGADTPYLLLAAGMLLTGSGMGATMQNLVLAVQNTVPMREIGAASAAVSFIRTLGGAIGVSALGAVLAGQVKSNVTSGLDRLGVSASSAGDSGAVPDPAALPAPVAHVVRSAYATGISWVFLISAIAAALGAIAIWFIREAPLRTTISDDAGEPENPLQVASESVAAAEGVGEVPTYRGVHAVAGQA
jgi:EmrB/QacA subfamily drug resistance transporter